MQCSQCHAENPDRARFCEDCGARLEYKCPHCAEATTPGKRFCASCGGSLVAAPADARPALSPQDYTPQHLAERIISSRGALEGERKQVTVLFADLKGSMELLADRDPEDARRILDPILERMMEAVHRYEGTVNQVMGDGIMALFGAPLAHEDHAVRACYAALRMQEAVKDYADDIWRSQSVRIQIRVGLNSGEVVVRSIGSDLRMDYTAVGQTTHLAARMEQLASPGSVLLAPDALQLAEGYVQVKALGPVQVKGLSEPIEVYELLGAGTARSRLQAAAARGLTRFVGRDAELDTLRRTLEQAASGHGQVVALVGEPGVGKSRLVWEFAHSHRTHGWLVLESGSVSYGKASSYLPVIDLLKSYCGVEDRDDPRRMREKLTGKLLTLDPTLQPMLPAFLALLDVPVEDQQWQALDPPQRRQRTLDALKRLLLRESQEQPLLLVFEDLHWIDAETQALLDSLVEGLPTARILLLVNYRPEYEHTWHRKTYYQQLRLDPLPPESADELLVALLGNAAELHPLKRVLIERTEGNPFFVEESVRTLVESGTLAGERGAYHLTRSFESTQVPATVQAVLAARIDRLPPEDKRLLQSAAVIGKDVPYALLHAIAELPEDALRQGLARLHAAEFLYETSLFPELEYTFKHALTHEVAYGGLLHERRRRLHAKIVEVMEHGGVPRLTEHVVRLAHHASRGELWHKAVTYSRQAGLRAAGRSAHREAVHYFEQALEASGHLPETRDTCEEAIDLRFDLRNSLQPLAELERSVARLHEAEALAEALGDQRRLAAAQAYLTSVYWNEGKWDRAFAAGERALAVAEAIGDITIQVQTSYRLGQTYYSLGSYRAAVDMLSKAVECLGPMTEGERFGLLGSAEVLLRTWIAMCCAELGDFADGAAQAEEGLRIAERIDHPFSLGFACYAAGLVYFAKGDYERARPLLERGVAICRSASLPLILPWAATPLGALYSLSGRQSEALALLEEVVQHAITLQRATMQSVAMTTLGEAYLRAGHATEALERALESLQLARSRGERGDEAWALRLLGEIVARTDSPEVEQAESYYRQALALAEELGMRPLAAHCHLGLGTLYQRVGRHEQAQAELATAAEQYRAMEMTLWLEKAEAVLAQVGAA
jgi:class 3 adenylate cyclase/tetratricopeptide (TPR) repeat protein